MELLNSYGNGGNIYPLLVIVNMKQYRRKRIRALWIKPPFWFRIKG